MPRDYFGKTLVEWREVDPETWPPRVREAIANSDRLAASDARREGKPPPRTQIPWSQPVGRRSPEREDGELWKPEEHRTRQPETEKEEALLVALVEARMERLTEIAHRYGDLDAEGRPVYGERMRANSFLLGDLALIDEVLRGNWRAAEPLMRFNAVTPELTVRHKIDLASDKDELLTMKARVWLGMDPSAQKSYLARLELEPRAALVERARQLDTSETE